LKGPRKILKRWNYKMTGIVFIARSGSTRLKDKHLIKAGDVSFLAWLLKRFIVEFKNEIDSKDIRIIIATAVLPENKVFEKIITDLPVEVFYGSNDNIPLRQLECADELGLSNIISIDGDDILCSYSAARKIYDELKNSRLYVKTAGLPLGMNAMGYQTEFLRNSLNNDLGKLETGWGRIFDETRATVIEFTQHTDVKDLRMTLDYEEDSVFFKTIIESIGENIITIPDKELIKIIVEKGLYKLNFGKSDMYWDNFNTQKNLENENS
jgi:spore coat polysaccharide biosynthesis protein SpsF